MDYDKIITEMQEQLESKCKSRGLNIDITDIEDEISDAIDVVNQRRRFEATPSTPFELKYKSLIIKLALASITKYGAEGEKIHNENGIVRHYDSAGEYPEALLSRIVPLAKAR